MLQSLAARPMTLETLDTVITFRALNSRLVKRNTMPNLPGVVVDELDLVIAITANVIMNADKSLEMLIERILPTFVKLN